MGKMRLLCSLTFLFAAACNADSGLPIFSVSQDRALDGNPHITVTFPNGQTDALILENRGSGDNCHYVGHLKHERQACVAVTGCLGREDMEFTILSRHATQSPMWKWKTDGSVELIGLPEPDERTVPEEEEKEEPIDNGINKIPAN